MKYQVARVFSFLGLLLLVSALTGCGNTMYGIGLDMDRIGQKLQGQHRQNWGGNGTNGYQNYPYGQPQQPNPYPQPTGPAYGNQAYPYQGTGFQQPTNPATRISGNPRYIGR